MSDRSTSSPLARTTLMALALVLPFAPACDEDDEPFVPSADAPSGMQSTDAAPGTDSGAAADTGGAVDAGSGDAGADAGPAPILETEIALVRLGTDGKPDPSFGTDGIARFDLGPSTASVRDSVYGLALDGQSRLVVFATAKGEGSRGDQDRIVFRVNPNGTQDMGFNVNPMTMMGGVHRLNIGGLTDHIRHGIVHDGKIVSSGYTAQPTGVGDQTANRVVLLRLGDDGKPDATFGVNGIVNSNPFMPADPAKTPWGMAEAYGVTLQAGKYVTTGYGRRAATGQVDIVTFRYTATGDLDSTWGSGGIVETNVAGDNDRGRNLVTLPGDRILVVGSATPAPMNVDALIQILEPNGTPLATFGTGGHTLFSFDRPDEGFFGAAVSPTGAWAAAAGHRAGSAAGMMEDADATILFLPLGAGGAPGTPVARVVPVHEMADDRFVSVAFGPGEKAYAAGFVVEGGDSRMVVARYDAPTGALDPTFGDAGIAKINVVAAGTEEAARAVVVQPDGKVVLVGSIEKR